MARHEVHGLHVDNLVCAQCGEYLQLSEVCVLNHRDPPRSLVSIPLEQEFHVTVLDGPDADEHGIVEHRDDGNHVHGDYSGSLEDGDDRQGVTLLLRCPRCDRGTFVERIFEILIQSDRTRFYADDGIRTKFGNSDPIDPIDPEELRERYGDPPDPAKRAADLRERFRFGDPAAGRKN